jgi:hypothetical protein
MTQEEARGVFHRWLKKKKFGKQVKVAPMRGLYMPAWTFDLAGELRWQCKTYRDEAPAFDMGGLSVTLGNSSNTRRWVTEKGSHPVYEDDILVPASHKLPADLIMAEMDSFLLGDVVPYDRAFLADWPAEVYQVSVSDASLVARRRMLEKSRRVVTMRLNATLGSVSDLQFNTAGVIVESYKLVLLPVWVLRYGYQKTVYHVIINGQTGRVRAQMPRNWLQKFFGSIFS